MSLLKELLSIKPAFTIASELVEAQHFADVYHMKFDPDRADVHGIVSDILPLICKIAYVGLAHQKSEHDKLYDDPEDEPFPFTSKDLAYEVEQYLDIMREQLSNCTTAEILEIIRADGELKLTDTN